MASSERDAGRDSSSIRDLVALAGLREAADDRLAGGPGGQC